MTAIRMHASCVSIAGRGVLLTGASGAGKSDLALRLIDRGARLVSDDYTDLRADSGQLVATAPDTIAGLIELRGLGLIRVSALPETVVHLLVELDTPVERLPEPRETVIAGVPLPVTSISPFEASAPIKLEWMLSRIGSA